ncbi:DUF5937 family protein [Plantactinospora sp. GCM10030261]|uniref:ArsR/SmtB family transcription factor n=1 Tax=Plantactinospora sp. GCM10030261 TaxID=3273420 RepID=UPI00361EDC46
MLRVGLGTRDLANIRFATSPLWEVVASVRVAKSPRSFPEHLSWSSRARSRLAGVQWQLLADLVAMPTKVIPSFLCPPPTSPRPTLDEELAALPTATAPDAVRTCLARLGEPATPRVAALLADPETGLARLGQEIRGYFDATIAPYWSRMLTLLDRQVLVGSERIAATGLAGLLNQLSPHVSLDGETLRVNHLHAAGDIRLDGRGLLLVPSIFAGPRVFSNLGSSRQPTLRYPVGGTAVLWERPDRAVGRSLGRVLGRTRARLLHELAVPASTTDLATRCGLAAGTVSLHLTALRDAGLVSSHRSGRYLLYARTSAAEAMLAGAGATSDVPSASAHDRGCRVSAGR